MLTSCIYTAACDFCDLKLTPSIEREWQSTEFHRWQPLHAWGSARTPGTCIFSTLLYLFTPSLHAWWL